MHAPTTLHIINHTHWDREWFLTSEYTSRWIPRLIDRIAQLAAGNPDFRYLFDGQTLVIEDLLAIAPHYEERVQNLVSQQQLNVGPYYCQPDWRLSSGELLIRNLLLGHGDRRALGQTSQTAGWLVDTFGHISQAPQIHRLFAIDAVFIWRGAPLLQPYFNWHSPDGSNVLAINLFGGYRNLYGVTHAPEVAWHRLQAELEKLRPYYPTPDIPLFDGYDLEDDPEDPVRFYQEAFADELQQVRDSVVLQESTPSRFARTIAGRHLALPDVRGELNSGKYGATFPGTLSARTYLKLMAHDCERLLFSRVEPLATMAHLHGRVYDEARYESWTRQLLQNAVHDCICGVSIDLVHEKMEDSYRRLFKAMKADLQASLATIGGRLQSGDYAVSTNTMGAESWQVVGDGLYQAQTEGAGIWPVVARHALQDVSRAVASFTWTNKHYSAHVQADGSLLLENEAAGSQRLGALLVSREHGDTYSTEPREVLGRLTLQSPMRVVQRSEHHAVLVYQAAMRSEDVHVTAVVRLWFDPSPLIRWQIDLDSEGVDLRVDMHFETGSIGPIYAGMPFDISSRPLIDRDLLPRTLAPALASVLLGQRELNAVYDFPMQDFLACRSVDGAGLAIFARGIRAYRTGEGGELLLPLRRAVQWLTRADLRDRIGDAGPFFYVPDARCERRVRHELAIAAGPFDRLVEDLPRLNETFQNPPLLVRVEAGGSERQWRFLQEDLPLSSLHMRRSTVLARFYNPLGQVTSLSQAYRRSDVWGNSQSDVSTIQPGEILTVQLQGDRQPAGRPPATITLLTSPSWRVGANRSRPQEAALQSLQEEIDRLGAQLASIETQLESAAGAQRLRLQHQAYVLAREQLEHRLSLALNRRKLNGASPPDASYLYSVDPQIAEIGAALNRLRIKRRIFDYVVQAL